MKPWFMKKTGLLIGLGALALGGCTTYVSGGGDTGGGGSGGGGGGGGPLPKADKVDILLMVDNSRSMADKQEVLALALSDLVQALVNPPCITPDGQLASPQPATPSDPCPAGSDRQYAPVADMHLGIISSSLGGHGSDVCLANSPTTITNDDKAHLLARLEPDGAAMVDTYQNKGFLAWDPSAKYSPPGESDAVSVAAKFKDMVLGVGQVGCGYEAQLESWYRFLAEPEPYESITVSGGVATLQGVDTVLLQQRADFLRPDSMLAIIMLSDENDCSIRDEGQYFYAAQQADTNGTKFHMPRARSECAVDPNDPCCKSCAQAAGECPADPTCTNPDGTAASLTDIEDHANVRCFDQKRRFGIDFLYPIERYTQALTATTVPNRAGELVPNPIYSDLNPNDAYTNIRDPGLVVLAGIVGVPWQEIARDPQNLALGFKSAQELADTNTWATILGDPANYVPPASPYMVESWDARAGVPSPNDVNGHDYTIAGHNDLQYACTFPLLQPRDCAAAGGAACDCSQGSDSPLCAPNPNDGGNTTLQVAAKAYPGLRELAVLQGAGTQGVTASICPKQITDPTAGDFAYRPAIRALLERMATRL